MRSGRSTPPSPMCCSPTGRGTPYSASSTSGAAACCCISHAHLLECRLHRTAPRDPRVGSPRCRAMRQRQEFISHHARTALKDLGIEQKPLPPSSRSANPSSSVRWAHFPTTCSSFCGLLRPRCERPAGDPLPAAAFPPVSDKERTQRAD